MKYEYYYCDNYSQKLIDFCTRNHIKYSADPEPDRFSFVTFSIFSTRPDSDELQAELRKEFNMPAHPIVYLHFTKKEMEQAELLNVRPIRQWVDIISYDSYEYSCYRKNYLGEMLPRHEAQVKPHTVAKEPSMKTKTALWSPDTGFSEVFADRRVYDLVKMSDLVGVDFREVFLKNGNVSEKLYQMTSKHKIDRDWIQFGHGEKKYVCSVCGKEQFYLHNAYQFHIDLSKLNDASDFYTTDLIWGEGFAHSNFFISQRFYRLLKQNNLAGGVRFTPVVNVRLD